MNPIVCSAKGCENTAINELRWNNPKIHKPTRRKVWLACAEHQQHLEQFLGARQFLKEVVPVGSPMPEGANDR
jgi:hypothetical protein